jgi:hypothetical protein
VTRTATRTKKVVIPAMKKEPERLFRGEPVHAPRSPWWTILGLVEGEGWYELYQAKTEGEGKKFLALALDDPAAHMQKWDDLGLYEPQIATKRRDPEPAPMSALPSVRRRAGAVKRKK